MMALHRSNASRFDAVLLQRTKSFMATFAQSYMGLLAAGVLLRIERTNTVSELTAIAALWHMAIQELKQDHVVADMLLNQAKYADRCSTFHSSIKKEQ
jgi:hypothetical protein